MITYILPIGSELDYKYAFELLLPSFFHYHKEKDYKFVILYKSIHKNILDYYYLNDGFDYTNFDFIDEESLYMKDIPEATYYFQMYLKLLAYKIVETDFYVTLDSDIIFTMDFNNNNFIENNKAYTYLVKSVDTWIVRANKYFDVKLEYSTNQTPFVFKTKLVKEMFDKVDVESIIMEKNCNEYGSFFAFMIKNKLFKDNYIIKPFRKVGLNYKILKDKSKEDIIKAFHQLAKTSFISVIQSRTLIHNKLKNEFKKYIPNCKFKMGNIALLTIIGGKDYYQRYKLSVEIKKLYCRKNFYDFYFIYKHQKVDGWAKIEKLLEVMKENKYEYIFVSDGDVTITNLDRRVETIVNRYYGKDYICYMCTDNNSLNSGNIIWKSCPQSILFLEKMLKIRDDDIRYSIKTPFVPKGIYEQPSLIYLYNKYENWRALIKIIPQFEINSYSKFLVNEANIVDSVNGVVNRLLWEPGDFLVHYAGANYKKLLEDKEFNEKMNGIISFYQRQIITKKEGNDFGKIK